MGVRFSGLLLSWTHAPQTSVQLKYIEVWQTGEMASKKETYSQWDSYCCDWSKVILQTHQVIATNHWQTQFARNLPKVF
jgi:hypothetical protein